MNRKQTVINSNNRKKINIFLYSLSRNIYGFIPLYKIIEFLDQLGYTLIQEDNTKFQGFLCGSEGRASINIGRNPDENGFYQQVNNVLMLSWYRLVSGKYEINSYVS